VINKVKIVQRHVGIPSFILPFPHFPGCSRTAAARPSNRANRADQLRVSPLRIGQDEIRRLGPFGAGILLFALGCLTVMGQTPPAVEAIYCAHENFHGSGIDSCSVTLAAKAGSSGVRVSLKSGAVAAKVPATVLVPSGRTHVDFSTTISAVGKTETAILTAKEGSSSKTFSIKLAGDEYGLSVSAAKIAFGDVALRSPATQSITLKSIGIAAVTVSSAKLTGTGFSLKTNSFPIKLNPGQTAVLDVEFDPAIAGAQTGKLTIASDSNAGSSTVVALTGTGEAASYQVDLSWNEASDSAEKIAGYRIYRANKGSSSYGLLNSAIDTETAFTDKSVTAGSAYDYYVESVDTAGISSAPSGVFAIAIP
jgi:hypothetical protein